MGILDQPISNFSNPEVITVKSSETIGYAVKIMVKNRFRRLLIVDDQEKLVGILTTTDILKALHDTAKMEFLMNKISTVMTSDLTLIESSSSLKDTILTMFNSGISGVPIVENESLVGIFTVKDCLLLNQLWKEIPDQLIASEDSIGRPINTNTILTTDHTIWQATDKFIELSQRQVLIKKTDTNQFVGILAIRNIIEDLASKLLLDETKTPNVEILHSSTIESLSYYPVLQRGIPILISSLRIWLNSRGIEACPLFQTGKPMILITEQDLFGYLISKIT